MKHEIIFVYLCCLWLHRFDKEFSLYEIDDLIFADPSRKQRTIAYFGFHGKNNWLDIFEGSHNCFVFYILMPCLFVDLKMYH